MADLLIQILPMVVRLEALAVKTLQFLAQLVNSLIFYCIVAILGVKLLNEILELLFLRLDVNRVPLQVVMLLSL